MRNTEKKNNKKYETDENGEKQFKKLDIVSIDVI